MCYNYYTSINVCISVNLLCRLTCTLYLTQAEGKVDNYTDLAGIDPYPSKRVPPERVEYTDVVPSSVRCTHQDAHTYVHTCAYVYIHTSTYWYTY